MNYICKNKSVRPIIAPNLGFWRQQMIEWEGKKNGDGKSSVQLVKGVRQLQPIPDVYLPFPIHDRYRRAVGRGFHNLKYS
jgi:hypothetical protein